MAKTMPCKSCGDPVLVEVAAKSDGRCLECYRELAFGEVPNVVDSSRGRHKVSGSGRELEDEDGGARPEDFEGAGEPGGESEGP